LKAYARENTMAAGKIDTKIPYFIRKEGNSFVAYSPALDIYSCGSTEKEADKRIKEAAEILIEELVEMGTLGEVLTECGWKRMETGEHTWTPPEYKQKSVQIEVGAGA
jgi:predicted RNase H-like HicB family nuclease